MNKKMILSALLLTSIGTHIHSMVGVRPPSPQYAQPPVLPDDEALRDLRAREKEFRRIKDRWEAGDDIHYEAAIGPEDHPDLRFHVWIHTRHAFPETRVLVKIYKGDKESTLSASRKRSMTRDQAALWRELKFLMKREFGSEFKSDVRADL